MIGERLGPELAAVTGVDLIIAADAVVAADGRPGRAVPDPRPGACSTTTPRRSRSRRWRPSRPTPSTSSALGVPTYGFSPLRQPPDETYLDRWHGVDERVSVEGLRWGLPVLYDAVRRFCG